MYLDGGPENIDASHGIVPDDVIAAILGYPLTYHADRAHVRRNNYGNFWHRGGKGDKNAPEHLTVEFYLRGIHMNTEHVYHAVEMTTVDVPTASKHGINKRKKEAPLASRNMFEVLRE